MGEASGDGSRRSRGLSGVRITKSKVSGRGGGLGMTSKDLEGGGAVGKAVELTGMSRRSCQTPKKSIQMG